MIDFNEVQTFELVPAGDYDVICVNVKKGLAKTSGKEKLDIRWKILSPESVDGKKTLNRQLLDSFTMQANSYWKLKNCLIAAESKLLEGTAKVDGIQPIMKEFKNMVLTVTVEEDDYKGKPQNKVSGYKVCENKSNYLTATTPKPTVDEDDLPF